MACCNCSQIPTKNWFEFGCRIDFPLNNSTSNVNDAANKLMNEKIIHVWINWKFATHLPIRFRTSGDEWSSNSLACSIISRQVDGIRQSNSFKFRINDQWAVSLNAFDVAFVLINVRRKLITRCIRRGSAFFYNYKNYFHERSSVMSSKRNN